MNYFSLRPWGLFSLWLKNITTKDAKFFTKIHKVYNSILIQFDI